MNTSAKFDIFGDSDVQLCDASDLTSLFAEAKPVETSLPKGGKEHRTAQRYIARWRVTASVDQNSLHHGHLKDISTKGAAVLFEQNFQVAKFIKLHIYMPPPPPGRLPCIVEVIGRVVYTIHDPKEHRFRTGIEFLKFATTHDPHFLDNHLANHATPAEF